MIQKRCVLCGEKEKTHVLYPRNFEEKDLTPEVYSARRVTEHFHYTLVRCECGMIFSREILPDDRLQSLYAASRMTFEKQIPVIRRDYARHLKPFLWNIKKNAALEIGCSNGFFLEELKSLGFAEVRGCEPSLDAAAQARPDIRAGIHNGFFTKGIFSPQSFDLVCSFQTLDHVSDPIAVLEAAREVLKPGGLAYFVCHNTDALQVKIFGEKSPIVDVEHIYLFNLPTLRALFEKAGFHVIHTGALQNSYPLEYWARMMPLPPGMKSLLQGFLHVTGLGRLQPRIRAGNMLIVAQAPAQQSVF